MAGHRLIEAYLAALARQLPADIVDELADGLAETYRRHRAAGLPADAAAHATITEFGQPDTVLTAFVRHAPGRRAALMLLGTGPIFGLCWGTTLISGHPSIPITLRAVFGTTLLAVIAALALAATTRQHYRRTRLTIGAGLAIIAIDGAMIAAVLLSALPFVWPMVLAIPASLTRMTLTARAIPRLLTT